MDDFNHNNNNMTPESRGDEHTEAQQPTMEQPATETQYTEPRTPYQTPVQHPAYHQATQQQQPYGGAPYAQDPMGSAQQPQPPKKKKHGKAIAIGLGGVAAACLLFAGGALIGHMVYTGDGNAVKASAQAGDLPTVQLNEAPNLDPDNYDVVNGLAGEEIYKKVSPSIRFGHFDYCERDGVRLGRHHE